MTDSMTPDLIVLPTLERLRPYESGPTGELALGMVFSVTLQHPDFAYDGRRPKDQFLANFLQPWTWSEGGSWFLPIKELQVYRRAPADKFWKNAGTIRVTPRSPLPADRLQRLHASLARRFCDFASQKTCSQPSSPWTWEISRPQTIDPDCRPWSAFVGHVTQLPWPVPQALGLSFFEHLHCGRDEILVAAPVLRVRGASARGTAMQRSDSWLYPDLGEVSNGGDLVRMSYGAVTIGSATLRLEARTPELQPTKPAASFFDMETLWVAGAEVGDDCFSGLDNRLSTQLDLARVVLDWLSDAGGASNLRRENYARAARLVLRALRLHSLPAPKPTSLGGNLLRRLAPVWADREGKPFTNKAADALSHLAGDWFAALRDGQDLKGWACWANAAMEAAGGAPRVLALTEAGQGPDPITQLTLADVASQLAALSSRLAAGDVVLAIFRSAWKAWLAEAGARATGSALELARAFAQGPLTGRVDLGYEMLRASVRDELAALLRKTLAPENAASLDRQRQLLVEELGNGQHAGPIWQELRDVDPHWCDERAAAIASVIFPCPGRSVAQSAITGGVTVQVDGLSIDRENDDRLADIQGVAVLMRDVSGTPPSPWCCLNMASAEIDGEPLVDTVLLPSRIAYQGGVCASTLTYDNQPLAVAGPLAAAQVCGASMHPSSGATAPLDAPLLDFSYCTSGAGRMPELVFGRKYEILPFLVTNSGAIPKALTPAGAETPWELALPIADDAAVGVPVRPVPVAYRRTASVGALRLASPKSLPAVPVGVAPRLRELPPELLLPAGDPLRRRLSADTSDDTVLSGTPLMLLAPPDLTLRRGIELKSRVDFEIASPTLDLRTWDRWVAADATPRERRMFIWRSFHQLAHRAAQCNHGRTSLVEAGVFLDDPAVVGVWAELQSVSPNGDLDAAVSLDAPILFRKATGQSDWRDWRQDNPSLCCEQRSAVKIAIEVRGPNSIQVTVDGKLLGATPHALCRLTLYAVLSDDAGPRFQGLDQEAVRTVGRYKLTSPWHLFVEVVPPPVAKDDLTRVRQALWRALTPQTAAARDGMLRAALDLSDAVFADLAWQIDRADLLHQVWSWRGRPPAQHPDLLPDPGRSLPRAAEDELERYLDFEMAEFGERSDEERRDLPMQRRDCAATGAGPYFSYQENLESIASPGDFRALHHRLSVRIWSRYRAVLPPTQGFVEALDSATRTRWRRLFVPCRFRGVVPVPKIKFVLPLTQEDSAQAGPGLMVAVDGPWYQVGGLAEELQVEVVTATPPDSSATAYYQAGTDPIVTCSSAGDETDLAVDTPGAALDPLRRWTGALPVDDLTIDFSQKLGAIGHTRDHTTVAPRFIASSFLLAPPVLRACCPARLGNPAPDLAWWFFELRFARRLAVVRPEGAKPASEELLSEWSAPFWVQLLPALERVETDWFPDGVPTLRLRGPKTLTCSTMRHARRAPFYLFAVMTRRLSDFAGRANQEAYVGVWWWNAGRSAFDTDAETAELVAESDQQLLVRWIEVQSPRSPDITCSDGFWHALFDSSSYTSGPSDDGVNAPAVHPDALRCRIVRISKPFAVQSAGERP